MSQGMVMKKILVLTLAAAGLASLPLVDSSLSLGWVQGGAVYAGEQEGRRPPPEARSSGTLSQQVAGIINRVMELREAEDLQGAERELARLRDMFGRGRLNPFESYTMWQFYANVAYLNEDLEGALANYERMAGVEGITPQQLENALFSVAQLQFALERWEAAIASFQRYMEIAAAPSNDVYLRIGQAYYQLERYADAIPQVRRNMELERASGSEVPQSTYALLRALYFSLEDYQGAHQVLREMIVLFNDPADWGYLAAVNSQLERFEDSAYVYYVANAGGYLDSEAQLVSLAAQMSSYENPFGAAQVMEKGIQAGVIKETETNLSYLSQFYQLAREDERALVPLEKAAEMTGKGEYHARLGQLYLQMGEFEEAAEAYNAALRAGGVDRPDQVQLRLAQTYWQLNRYDEALAAARRASTDERSRDTAQAYLSTLENEKRRYETLRSNRELFKDYFIN